MEIPSAFFPIFGAVFLAAGSIAMRVMMRGEKDAWAATAVNEIIGTAMILALIALAGIGFYAPADFDFAAVPQNAWMALGASALLFAIITFLTYKSYNLLEAGEVRILTQLTTPWTILLALGVFSESISALQWAGILLTMGGVALATVGGKLHSLKNDGVKIVLICVLLYGFTSVTDKYAIAYFPPLIYALPVFLAPAMLAIVMVKKESGLRNITLVGKRHFWLACAVAATNILGYMGVVLAFRYMPLAIASPIIGTSVVLTVGAGALLLGEKEGWQWKVAGAAAAFAGVALMGA